MLKTTKERWVQQSGLPAIVLSGHSQEPAAYQQSLLHSTQMPTQRILSSKQLDLLLLATCSCLLTLLSQPAPSLLPAASGSSSSAIESSAPSTTPQLSFYIKSALLSSYQDKEKSMDEGAER